MTSGASHNNPVPFEYGGEIKIGEKCNIEHNRNEVYYVPTGAAVPEGYDSVEMIEDCERTGDTVYFEKTLFEGENIIYRGEDIKCGEKIVNKGDVLRSVDIGIIASQGIERISVYKKVKIALIPTGKELRKPGRQLQSNAIYDINSFMLNALFDNPRYFETTSFDIIGDDENELRNLIKRNYEKFDVFLISGGSSKGMRDITVDVINGLGAPGIVTHGIDMSPGKPTILAVCNGKIIFGAPGHPVSSYISTRFVMVPILKWVAGNKRIFEEVRGTGAVTVDIPSKHGLEEFFRVEVKNGKLNPVYGQSGMISTLYRANGIIIVESEREGVYKGEEIEYFDVI